MLQEWKLVQRFTLCLSSTKCKYEFVKPGYFHFTIWWCLRENHLSSSRNHLHDHQPACGRSTQGIKLKYKWLKKIWHFSDNFKWWRVTKSNQKHCSCLKYSNPHSWHCYRLENSPYFCVFKYARAVKQKVWNKAENRERE